MNLNQFQSIVSPIFSPAAPAVLLGSQLYSGLADSGVPAPVALAGAIASGLGMEAAGALAFSVAMIAIQRRAKAPAVVAILCVVFYALFAIAGIQSAPNGVTFAAFIGLSLVSFGASGGYRYITEIKAQEASKIAALDAERKLINAQARLAKTAQPAGQRSVNDEQSAERSVNGYTCNPETLARAREIFSAYQAETGKAISGNELARRLGVSQATGQRYKAEVMRGGEK